MKLRVAHLCTTVAVASMGSVAAASQMQLSLSSVMLDAGGSFDGVTHTGMLYLSMDADSALSLFQIDSGENLVSGNPLTGLSGYLFLSEGIVTGGSLSLTAGADSFTSMIPERGETTLQDISSRSADTFAIDGLGFESFFSSGEFAGVDVSDMMFDGEMLLTSMSLEFSPDFNGMDSTASMDLRVGRAVAVVPSPAAAGMGLLGLAGVIGRRHRRM